MPVPFGAPRDAAGNPRRPDAATFNRVLRDPAHAQQADDVLCVWTAARARDLRPGMRKHLRVDVKALRGAARLCKRGALAYRAAVALGGQRPVDR